MSTDGAGSWVPAMAGRRLLARVETVAPSGAAAPVRTLLDSLAQHLAFARLQLDAVQGTSADTRDVTLRHTATIRVAGKAE